MIVGFALYYRRKMPRHIYAFVQNKDKEPAQPPESPQEPSSPSPAWTGAERTIGRPRPSQAETEASQATTATQADVPKPKKPSTLTPWIHAPAFVGKWASFITGYTHQSSVLIVS